MECKFTAQYRCDDLFAQTSGNAPDNLNLNKHSSNYQRIWIFVFYQAWDEVTFYVIYVSLLYMIRIYILKVIHMFYFYLLPNGSTV